MYRIYKLKYNQSINTQIMVDEPVKGSTGVLDKHGSDRSHSGLDKPKFPDFSKLTKAQDILDRNKYVDVMFDSKMLLCRYGSEW